MKNKNIKLISSAILLAALMLFTAACSGKAPGQDVPGATENAGSENTENTENTENAEADEKTPEVFRILIGSVGADTAIETPTGDAVDNAVCARNRLCEQKLGIDLSFEQCAESSDGKAFTEKLRSILDAGSDDYGAFIHVYGTGMQSLCAEGYFADWNSLDGIDTSADYWYSSPETLSFDGRLYGIAGDHTLYFKSISCLAFNKELFSLLGIEFPYELVKDGSWTWEKFTQLVATDVSEISDDAVGLCGWGFDMDYAMVLSQGFFPLETDAESKKTSLLKDPESADAIYRKITEFLTGENVYRSCNDYESVFAKFSEGRSLFCDMTLAKAATVSGVDMGLIPYPASEENAGYISRLSGNVPLTYIPDGKNAARSAVIIEALAKESNGVKTTFFDEVSCSDYTRDAQTEEMLPYICGCAKFLPDGFSPSIVGMVNTKNNTFLEDYESMKETYADNLSEMTGTARKKSEKAE